MENSEEMNNENLIMLWGFIFFFLGAFSIVQIGLFEGLDDFLIIGTVSFLIGIIILIYIAFIDKKKVT
ncbi:MAG: hypothetical protein ACFE9Q_16730 [Candidatus Hodarchaeota archaeon]